MKKIIILLLALICVSMAFGQTKKQSPQKIAVYVTDDEQSGVGSYAAAAMVDAITHNSNYTAVERTAEFLRAINSEHEYQRSGMIADEQIARLGKQFGTKLVCVIKIGTVVNKYFIQARLLEVETASIKNSTKAITFLLDDVEDACTTVITQLLTENQDTRTIHSAFGMN
jgi:hypothetical protein